MIETLAITIGPAIAKNILKTWLGDNSTVDITGTLIDLIAKRIKDGNEKREIARQIDRIGDTIARNLKPFFDNEFCFLKSEDRTLVINEVANTLGKVKFSGKLLLENDLDPNKLNAHLLKARKSALDWFTSDQKDMYERILEEVSKSILEYANQFADFDRLLACRILSDHELIITKLDKILTEPQGVAKRYEQDYRSAVKEKLDRFELFGIPSRDNLVRRQKLRDAYVVLSAKPTTYFMENEGVSRKIGLEEHRLPPSISGDHILNFSRRIVLRGDAGSGKSTLLKWLAIQAASQQVPGGKEIVPFYIRLREFVGKPLPNDEELPVIWFSSGCKPDHWVSDLLDKGHGLILLDGMDELPAKERPSVLNRLKDLILAYPLAHYVVSSRPPAIKTDQWPEWQQWIEENHFVDLSLQEMDEIQVTNFIKNWFSALQISLSNNEDMDSIASSPDNLLRLLALRPQLRLLAANPLLCAMICALFHDRQQSLPSERIKLYEECIQMLLTRREEARGIRLEEEYARLNDTQKIGMIQGFAYWLMKNGYSDADIEEVDNYFEKALPFFNITGTDGKKIRRFFVERANLLREPAFKRIDFMHRTLQEYLSARAAIEADEIGLLNNNALDDQWREVIILAVGLGITKQRERLLHNLIKKADSIKTDERRRALRILTLACLETQSQLSPEIREVIFDKAKEFFPPRDADEARMVAKAGDPAIRLLKIYPHQSADEASSCQYTLVRIGGDNALPALENYACRPDLADFEILLEGMSFFDQNPYCERVLSHLVSGRIADHELYYHRFVNNIRSFTQLKDISIHFLFQDVSDTKNTIAELEKLPSLERVRIFSRRPLNFSILEKFTQLKTLLLGYPGGKDFSAIRKLIGLEELTLNGNGIVDLSPLANLKNLSKLDLTYSRVRDLSPLINLPKLNEIKVNADTLDKLRGIEELSPEKIYGVVDGRRFVRKLSLQHHDRMRIKLELSDLDEDEKEDSGESKLPNIAFKLVKNIENINISILPYIREINLSKFPLCDLRVLSILPNLSILEINHTAIKDIAPLANQKQLLQLDISNTEISNLEPLSDLVNLTDLDISGCPVVDLSPLSNLTKLRRLNIGDTKVTDLSPLSNLKCLESLRINRTPVTTIEPLSNNILLRNLFANGLSIDFGPVLQIPELQISRYKVDRFSFRR